MVPYIGYKPLSYTLSHLTLQQLGEVGKVGWYIVNAFTNEDRESCPRYILPKIPGYRDSNPRLAFPRRPWGWGACQEHPSSRTGVQSPWDIWSLPRISYFKFNSDNRCSNEGATPNTLVCKITEVHFQGRTKTGFRKRQGSGHLSKQQSTTLPHFTKLHMLPIVKCTTILYLRKESISN